MNLNRKFQQFFQAGFSFSLLALLLFGILKWIGVPAGSFFNWLIGMGIFWWLMLIVTIPWDIYFKAKEVLQETIKSKDRTIKVDKKDQDYIKRITRIALWVVLGLHIASTIGLWSLAHFQITFLGYYGAIAALLLSFLRPAARLYHYVNIRLSTISQEAKYPREDLITFVDRVKYIEQTTKEIEKDLNPNEKHSFRKELDETLNKLSNDIADIKMSINQQEQKHQQALMALGEQSEDQLKEVRQQFKFEQEKMTQKVDIAVTQLATDGRLIHNIREVAHFIRNFMKEPPQDG